MSNLKGTKMLAHQLRGLGEFFEPYADEIDALRAEVEALRAKIKDHNDDCLSACVARGANGDCEAWTSRGMKCCDCPTDDMIEIDGAARQPPEGQKP